MDRKSKCNFPRNSGCSLCATVSGRINGSRKGRYIWLKKRLPCLTAYHLKIFLSECKNARDIAFILFMGDSGLQRSEVIALNLGDVTVMSGLVRVKRCKGGKGRSAVIRATTRCGLLSYRRILGTPDGNSHLFR